MLLSKSCIYAIRASIYLAVNRRRTLIPIKEVADTLSISFHFLTKILQILKQENIIDSVKGPNGGVGLLRQPHEISLYDIIIAVDGDAIFEKCILGLPGCSDDNPCPMHHIWRHSKADLTHNIQNETLNALAEKIEQGEIRLFDIPKF